MIGSVMSMIRNYFERDEYSGNFEIHDGSLSVDLDAPFVAIVGSHCHDGVWELLDGNTLAEWNMQDGTKAAGEHDESFAGSIYLLFPPRQFLAICQEIADYAKSNPVGAMQSERLGEYSYTRTFAGDGGVKPWESAFAGRLNQWRRMFTTIDL